MHFVPASEEGGLNMAMLKRLVLKGFRSIRDMDLELRPINVLIGANGAGKSNLISYFKMLNEMMGGRLQTYFAGSGRAQSLLHYGPKQTPQMDATLEFETDQGLNVYHQRLFHVAGDTLAFAEETLDFKRHNSTNRFPPPPMSLGSGHQETRISDEADRNNPTAGVFRHLLNHCRVFHFHDTSPAARARAYCSVTNDRWLMPDAGNVAAMLWRFKNEEGNPAYRRILGTVRQIAPFLGDFELEPTGPQNKDIILNWKDRMSGDVFGAHQLSDGTLRFIALAALLLQPQRMLPDVIVIDEPELGLHPAGLNLLGGMLRSASHHCQIVVSTQSAPLLDGFGPEDVVVVNRRDGASNFERLNEDQLKDWLDQYTLGQLWEKNVVGGGPFG
jgi:predicted ATPase